MKPAYFITAAVAIAMFWQGNMGFAHPPTATGGHSTRTPASAMRMAMRAAPATVAAARAAHAAAVNERFISQMPLPLANLENTAIATQLATSNTPLLSARAAQIAGQNPRLSPQQALLLAQRESSSIASNITGTNGLGAPAYVPQSAAPYGGAMPLPLANLENTAMATQLATSNASLLSARAAQIAQQNPRLSPQQALLLAQRESSAIATQIATSNGTENSALATQIAAQTRFLTPETAASQVTLENPETALQQATSNAARAVQQESVNDAAAIQDAATNAAFVAQGGLATTDPAGVWARSPWHDRSRFYNDGGYQSAILGPVDYGAYDDGYGGGYGMPQTAPGAALLGTAAVIAAQGQFNQDTGAAAVNAAQGESNSLRNVVQRVQTFWQMRDIGRAERQKERGPLPATSTPAASTPRGETQRGLTANQIDPVTGVLYWPGPLQAAEYAAPRRAIDDLTARWAQSGTLDFADQRRMRENILAMMNTMKSRIAEIPPQQYLSLRSFLQSLMRATTGGTI